MKEASKDDYLAKEKHQGVEVYEVVVDYSLTLDKMVAVGKYDRVNQHITSNNFPFQGKNRKKRLNIGLICLNHLVTSDRVIEEIDPCQANLVQLLALGAQHPNVQRKFPITALSSVWRYKTEKMVEPIKEMIRAGKKVRPILVCPFLWGDPVECYKAERRLGLVSFTDGWPPYWRFAVVIK